jgi:hypothetical protein
VLPRPDRARSVGPIVSTVERQLLSQREPVSWDADLATQLSDSILEPECPVVIAGMNFENGGIERAKFVLQGAKYRRTPPSPFGSANLLQRLVIGLEHGVWGDQAMLGREDEPAVTGAFDMPTTTPKERGSVEVASLSGPVEFGLNAADKADPARVRHDEMSRVRRASQPRRPSQPAPIHARASTWLPAVSLAHQAGYFRADGGRPWTSSSIWPKVSVSVSPAARASLS